LGEKEVMRITPSTFVHALLVFAVFACALHGEAARNETNLENAIQPSAKSESPVLLLISANRRMQSVVAEGWAVVVEAEIFLKPEAGTSLTITNPAGAWSDALKLTCSGQDGADHSVLFVPAYVSKSSIELTSERSAKAVWIIEAVDRRKLPEGTYEIRAALDSSKLGTSTLVDLRSPAVELVVAPEAAIQSPGAGQQKCLVAVSAALWKNNPTKALELAASHLAMYPGDVAVRFKEGRIQRSQGHYSEALTTLDIALKAAQGRPELAAEAFIIRQAIEDLHQHRPKR
jgi:hypothetical protein